MVLKELEIQGFKSFPDRTRVKFDKGITAVVGPNGSGKSNISDAIRWVLGETSSKQLRGAGKMEDVIFGGTQLRSAMGYAMVNLTLDNADRRLEVDADEVVIGRKYYRSGESEYSINGQNVRLKDVYELFLDTGLGRDGYSIIGQGRIAEIVGAKSAERREIFEEASGIAKYRYRKNEAERRLAGAEDNLTRLRDILGELESRVGPLERESKKAVQFLELSEKRKELEVTLWVDGVRRAKDTVRAQQRQYETAQADYDSLTAEIEAIDAETEQLQGEMQRLMVEVERCNAAIRSITEEQAGSDSRLAVLQNDIDHNNASIASFQEEIEAAGAGREGIAAEITAHRQAMEELERRMAELEAEAARREEQLQAIQAENAATGERRGAVTGLLAQLTARQTDAKVRAAGAASSAAAAAERLEAIAAERQKNDEALQNLKTEQADTAAYRATVNDTLARLENVQSGLKMKLASRQKQLDEADAAEQQITRQREAAVQRLQVLGDLERSMDGYQQSVKTVMRAAQNRRLRGILGTVSGILTVQHGYELAIETALGYALQNIVVDGESAAKAAIAFLRDEKAGRATFLPLDTVKGTRLDASRLSGSARVAADLVQCDQKYDQIVANLLGRIIVVDEINEASRVARSLDWRNRVVTVDGQVINAGGSFTGGSTSRSAGLFSRRQEMEELKKKVAQLEQKQDAAAEATDKWKAEVDALNAQLTAAASEGITAGGDKIRAEAEARRIEAALSQTQAAAELSAAEADSLAAQKARDEAEARAAAAEQEKLAGEIAALEKELAELAGSDDSFLATRARLSDELSAVRMQRLEAGKDKDLHAAAIDTLTSRSGESEERRLALEANIARLQALNHENAEKMAAVRLQKEEAAGRIEEQEAKIAAASARRMEKEGEANQKALKVRAITDQREKMSQEMARLAERKAAAEVEYDQTISKLWEEYQLTLTDAQSLCVEFDNAADLRRQVGEVRGKIRALGNVNVAAIEEYKEVSGRYETLRDQVRDVEKSKAELTRMIGELSSEMKTIFSESFERINGHFGRIFNALFGGGSASLSLADPENVLESGIDIQVAPPGKVIKNLSALSGGEQALVAISIYFAILAVNPAPFCILDEIEAALDDVNVVRYAQYLRRICDATQFIVITHRRGTMEAADVLYGVTMQEDGVSKLLRLDLDEVDASLVS
ncbi:chromosome segregation protein SMC [Candidatus Allofournierella merdavium]|uniref:chromosome segregation protein SMC n=1 Tax=Candidatus Allofournierella merdavium TaxID=2838593 RepID=UPI00374FA79D